MILTTQTMTEVMHYLPWIWAFTAPCLILLWAMWEKRQFLRKIDQRKAEEKALKQRRAALQMRREALEKEKSLT